MHNTLSIRSPSRRIARGLAWAGVMGAFAIASISAASAQATAGSIFGRAPAGDSITVHSDITGVGRTVKADSAGHYYAQELPIGTYTVTLKQKGRAIAKHLNVPVIVGRGVEVDFKCGEINCEEVTNTK